MSFWRTTIKCFHDNTSSFAVVFNRRRLLWQSRFPFRWGWGLSWGDNVVYLFWRRRFDCTKPLELKARIARFVSFWTTGYTIFRPAVACVTNVSVGLESKERPRNGIFGVLPARKNGRGNSLLPNPTETLAMQACPAAIMVCYGGAVIGQLCGPSA